MSESGTRTESDSMGTIAVPADRHRGAHTQRPPQHFKIGADRQPRPLRRPTRVVNQAPPRNRPPLTPPKLNRQHPSPTPSPRQTHPNMVKWRVGVRPRPSPRNPRSDALIRSMTGFGDASTQVDGVHYSVELRSLNNKYFKCSVRLPDQFQGMEAELEPQPRKRVSRGSFTSFESLLRIIDIAQGIALNGHFAKGAGRP